VKLLELSPTIAGTTFAASMSGSCKVNLPNKIYQTLTLSVSGAGCIDGNGATTTLINVNLSGAGSVHNLHATGSGVASVNGAGNICISATDPSMIIKQRSGVGNVRVYRN